MAREAIDWDHYKQLWIEFDGKTIKDFCKRYGLTYNSTARLHIRQKDRNKLLNKTNKEFKSGFTEKVVAKAYKKGEEAAEIWIEARKLFVGAEKFQGSLKPLFYLYQAKIESLMKKTELGRYLEIARIAGNHGKEFLDPEDRVFYENYFDTFDIKSSEIADLVSLTKAFSDCYAAWLVPPKGLIVDDNEEPVNPFTEFQSLFEENED